MRTALLWMLLSATSVSFTPAAVQPDHPQFATRPAKGSFLVARSNLSDPNFSQTVVLLLAYDSRGAAGIVINRPTDVRLASVLPGMTELHDRADHIFLGGPVAGNAMIILIRSASQPESSQMIFGDVYASGSLATLRQALRNTGKANPLRAYAGYAGWGTGQLEREIARGDWYVTPADTATVFDTPPAEVWRKLSDRFSGQWTRKPDGGEPIVVATLEEETP